MLFDTHVHFEALDGPGGPAPILERALAAGVTRLLAVGGNPTLNATALAAAARYPEHIACAVGFDRDQAPADPAGLCRELRARCRAARAVGELGLDFHYRPETRAAQMELLRAQLALARELRLPVILHSRAAEAETLAALAEHAAAWRGTPDRLGVLHCFTGERAFAWRLLDLGLHLSFSGIVTFRNAEELRTVAREIPAERLLIETDSPYLAPVPWRGRRNEPAFLPRIAEVLAATRGLLPEAIAELTRANAERLFDAGYPSHETG